MRRACWVVSAAVLAVACASGRATWTVDRIEGEVALLLSDQGERRAVPLDDLPEGIAEGEALVDNRVDEEAAQWLRRECAERRARLVRGDDGADLSLEEAP